MALNLAQLQTQQPARVRTVGTSAELAQRLAALGLRPGREVEVIRRGWLGGPLQLKVGGTEFMLRRSEAALIELVAQPVAATAPSCVARAAT
ncbi:FeoA family protein [Jeongeupia wiesaeckerbachi]|uniref:FeoA family protein n=1 Tax=Jeongeupia wiesaeckerbachi TaxID=3051218 RepID=UPI003D806191